jgi:hypothetical protein
MGNPKVPIIKVFPQKGTDADTDDALAPVRSALATCENALRVTELLKSHGALALVITPEYNRGIELDTGKDVIYHVVFNDKSKVDNRLLVDLIIDIEAILGKEGFPLACDQSSAPNLANRFAGSDNENPFSDIFCPCTCAGNNGCRPV